MTQNNDEALIEFKDAVKQLCNDFSSLQGNVYIKDVEASLDALCEQYIESTISQNEQQPKRVISEWKTIPEEELIQIYATYQRGYYEDDFRNYFKDVEARLRELNTAPTTSLTSETNTEVGNEAET